MSQKKISDADFDRAVLQYLRRKGYHEAEAALQSRMPKDASRFAQGIMFDSDPSITNYMLFFDKNESDSSAFSKSYGILRSWVHNSLDLYKAELSTVLFPIFVHGFLGLIKRDYLEEAQSFFKKYRADHLARHDDELRRLGSVTNMENKLMLLLSTLNEKIDFDIYGPSPIVGEAGEAEASMAALLGADPRAVNESKVKWEKLSQFHQLEIRALEEGNDAEANASRIKALRRDKKQRESDIPLPKMGFEEEATALTDLRERVSVSSSALPSACFFSFLNTHGTAISTAIAQDGSVAACGCSDSTIKVWDLNPAERSKRFVGNAGPDKSDGPQVLCGHSGPVYSVAVSPDTRFLISASDDCSARLWSLETKTNVVAYKGHSHPIWDVDIAPVGYYFATASLDRLACVWSTERATPLRLLAGHLSDVNCVKFHPNCNYVATGSDDRTVRLWDIQNGHCVRIFTGHTNAVRSLSMSSDGSMLLSCDEGGAVRLWDIGKGKEIGSCKSSDAPIWSVAFANSSGVFATGHDDCCVRLWSASKLSGSEASGASDHGLLKTLYTKYTPVYSVEFSRRNLLFAAGPFTPARAATS